jgi:hypothetical protein
MAEETGSGVGRNITLWTAAMGLVGGFLGSGAEGVLKWWEFHEHVSEIQQQQIMEVVKLATDLDKNKVESAGLYVKIVAKSLPEETRDQLLAIVLQSATSGATSSPQTVAQIAEAFPDAVTKSPELRKLVLPGHPRLFIQIAREDQKAGLEKIRGGLSGMNVDAPGIELIARYAGASELRYFFPQDADQASELATRLSESIPGLTCRLIGGFTQKTGAKPQLFELWVGPAFQSAQGTTPGGTTSAGTSPGGISGGTKVSCGT